MLTENGEQESKRPIEENMEIGTGEGGNRRDEREIMCSVQRDEASDDQKTRRERGGVRLSECRCK